jgi:uncharacterized protein YfbU (UPF0304 family)
MKIEEKDRLLLVNQYRILASLNKEDEKYYQEKIEILENGYEKLYQNLFENFSSEPLSAKDCNFVMDVLEMYGTGMTLSFNNLQTKSITKEEIRFPGFNTNEEFKYYSFTLFWLETLDRYAEIQEISNGNYRGIGENVNKYELMIEKWKSFGKYHLTEEQIKELIKIN